MRWNDLAGAQRNVMARRGAEEVAKIAYRAHARFLRTFTSTRIVPNTFNIRTGELPLPTAPGPVPSGWDGTPSAPPAVVGATPGPVATTGPSATPSVALGEPARDATASPGLIVAAGALAGGIGLLVWSRSRRPAR